jgi:hypothetical protein
MSHPRLQNTLRVAYALLYASIVFMVQNGYACQWQAELIDYTTQETTQFAIDETSVKIPIVQAAMVQTKIRRR